MRSAIVPPIASRECVEHRLVPVPKRQINSFNQSFNMTTTPAFDFEKLVPGFEFLKNIGKSQPGGTMTSAASWVAPTLDPKELDRKIQELKTVQFWLDQNAKAIGATIQALEVQKMTLSTLRGMNFSMNELSESLKANVNAWGQGKTDTPATQQNSKPAKRSYSFTNPKNPEVEEAPPTQPSKNQDEPAEKAAPAAVDPAVWWNSLGEQFQHIAQRTVLEMQKHAQNNQHLHSQAVAKRAAAKSSSVKSRASQAKSPAKSAKSVKTTKSAKPVNRAGIKTATPKVKRKTTE